MGHKTRTRLVPADAASISEAAALLRAGGLVAFPTETVYGLGADAASGAADIASITESANCEVLELPPTSWVSFSRLR